MSSRVVRWGGLAGVVAAVMWALTAILILLATPQRASFNSFSDYLLQIVLLVAYAGTLVATRDGRLLTKLLRLRDSVRGHYG
ncbi:MAG: hypothetical protein M3N45_01845 [Actinomycetota bacterium]|nr:hypothetical protein [Actinomycetota bacterium]